MDPRLTLVAIHPSFFGDAVVLEFLELLLVRSRAIIEKNRFVWIEVFKARITPMVLLGMVREVRRVALDSLRAGALAVKNRWFKLSLLHPTQGAKLSLTFEVQMRRFNF